MPNGVRSNLEIVVYGLGRLGGAMRKVPTEDIAHEVFQLAPDRFSWVLERYGQFPDKEVARAALEDAAKARYGALVRGSYAREPTKDGWSLTAAGIRWLTQNEKRIGLALGSDLGQRTQLSPREVRRFRARVKQEPAFHIYATSGSLEGVSRFMFTDMLRCSPDARSDLVHLQFDRLLSRAELAQDSEIIAFLRECNDRFRGLLGRKEDS